MRVEHHHSRWIKCGWKKSRFRPKKGTMSGKRKKLDKHKSKQEKNFSNRYCGWSNEPCSNGFGTDISSTPPPPPRFECVPETATRNRFKCGNFCSSQLRSNNNNKHWICWFSTKVYPFENFQCVFLSAQQHRVCSFLCRNIFICRNFTYNLIMSINWFICWWDCFICFI